MKKILSKFKPIKALLLAGAVLVMALPTRAQVGLTPRTGTLTNTPTLIETQVASNWTSDIVLFKGRGVQLWPYFAGTNSGTANVSTFWKLSPDGVNFSTAPFVLKWAMNGTTAVRGYTNLPESLVGNAKILRLATVSNEHTASVFLTNITWSAFP